jgi:putative membrane protein
MELLAKILIGFVAVEHIYILWLEMFVWTTKGKKVFRSIPEDMFEKTKVFAANQGLYNGFLASGLLWSLFIEDAYWSSNISMFFLTCVAIAGIYGGLTTQKSIFVKQGVPALLALIIVVINSL